MGDGGLEIHDCDSIQETRDETQERFIAAQPDAFAGSEREEKASACSALNDGVDYVAVLA